MKHAASTLIPILILIGLGGAGVQPTKVLQPTAAVQPTTALQPAAVVEPVAVVEPAPAVPAPPSSPDSVIGGTNQQRDLVDWALGQYEAAGMQLPELQFRLHADQEDCGGNQGSFTPDTTPWLVTVCTDGRMTFLHEIGHAWAAANLDEAERASYVERRGMETWNDPATPWRARGSEDAANTLAWGLVDDPIPCMTPDGPLAEKNAAFRLLTGSDSPRLSPAADAPGSGC